MVPGLEWERLISAQRLAYPATAWMRSANRGRNVPRESSKRGGVSRTTPGIVVLMVFMVVLFYGREGSSGHLSYFSDIFSQSQSPIPWQSKPVQSQIEVATCLHSGPNCRGNEFLR